MNPPVTQCMQYGIIYIPKNGGIFANFVLQNLSYLGLIEALRREIWEGGKKKGWQIYFSADIRKGLMALSLFLISCTQLDHREKLVTFIKFYKKFSNFSNVLY